MEQNNNFSEQLAKIKAALRQGDVNRLAHKAGVSTTTFRSAFTKTSALDMTEAEQEVLKACNQDRQLKERIQAAAKLEQDTKRMTEGGV